MPAIIIEDESTWPNELIECLERNYNVFHGWEARRADLPSNFVDGPMYDLAYEDLRDTLNQFSVKGYHCTRLTDIEMAEISGNGMSLQDGETLTARISRVLTDGLITEAVASRLSNEHQANEEYRAKMLWFCFFPPHIADESGIERFFRSWGGEALYNSHEDDEETGVSLSRIGTPCLIEVDVPIMSLSSHCSITSIISRVFVKNRGLETPEECESEGYAVVAIPKENIKRIIRFPSEDFIALTKCDQWDEPIVV